MRLRITTVLATGALVALSGCGASAGESRSEAEGPGIAVSTGGETELTSVRDAGLGIELPAGWDGRIDRQASGVPLLRAATFALPLPVSDPLGELTTDPALDLLGEEDSYIVLIDVTAPVPEDLDWVELAPPIGIDRSHFIDVERLSPPAPASRSLARRLLIVNERVLILFVWFGAARPSDAALAEANKVLATVSAGPWRPKKCPPDWPGPWTACPEADWVRRVTEGGGYGIVGETGSALVANGRGRSFYIWATKGRLPVNKRPLGSVEGVEVYGDERLWRWWPAQGFIFWMQAGPREDARLPDLGEMASLVRASRDVQPPE